MLWTKRRKGGDKQSTDFVQPHSTSLQLFPQYMRGHDTNTHFVQNSYNKIYRTIVEPHPFSILGTILNAYPPMHHHTHATHTHSKHSDRANVVPLLVRPKNQSVEMKCVNLVFWCTGWVFSCAPWMGLSGASVSLLAGGQSGLEVYLSSIQMCVVLNLEFECRYTYIWMSVWVVHFAICVTIMKMIWC